VHHRTNRVANAVTNAEPKWVSHSRTNCATNRSADTVTIRLTDGNSDARPNHVAICVTDTAPHRVTNSATYNVTNFGSNSITNALADRISHSLTNAIPFAFTNGHTFNESKHPTNYLPDCLADLSADCLADSATFSIAISEPIYIADSIPDNSTIPIPICVPYKGTHRCAEPPSDLIPNSYPYNITKPVAVLRAHRDTYPFAHRVANTHLPLLRRRSIHVRSCCCSSQWQLHHGRVSSGMPCTL
jgi:hypothetical protein